MSKKSEKSKKELEKEISFKVHEAKCRQCGKCCYKKAWINDSILIFINEHCPYLNPETKKCKIYPDRHKLNPNCCDIVKAIRLRALPADCPYVVDNPDYKAPLELDKL